MMSRINRQHVLRQLPESAQYRLPTEADLKPGARFYELKILEAGMAAGPPDPIKLDIPPVQSFGVTPYVHFAYERHPNTKGYVPKDYFLDVEIEPSTTPYMAILYLVTR